MTACHRAKVIGVGEATSSEMQPRPACPNRTSSPPSDNRRSNTGRTPSALRIRKSATKEAQAPGELANRTNASVLTAQENKEAGTRICGKGNDASCRLRSFSTRRYKPLSRTPLLIFWPSWPLCAGRECRFAISCVSSRRGAARSGLPPCDPEPRQMQSGGGQLLGRLACRLIHTEKVLLLSARYASLAFGSAASAAALGRSRFAAMECSLARGGECSRPFPLWEKPSATAVGDGGVHVLRRVAWPGRTLGGWVFGPGRSRLRSL